MYFHILIPSSLASYTSWTLVRGMGGCTGHCRQARSIASRTGVVLCDCTAILACGIGRLEADIVRLYIGRAALVIA